MNRNMADSVLHCAMAIGERLLMSGAEVCRVEDTIRRICMAYGAVRTDVFSITSSIVTTMFLSESESVTQTRRVSGMNNDLNRLDQLNQLSREICLKRPDPEWISRQIARIDAQPDAPFSIQLLIYALISGAFCAFFGGSPGDMAASAFIGMLLKCLESLIRRTSVNTLFTALLCSCAGGFLAHGAVALGLGAHVDMISIGNIMLFIPGIAFTNSLRDMFSGDIITGLIRFAESILLAIIVALGFNLAGSIL